MNSQTRFSRREMIAGVSAVAASSLAVAQASAKAPMLHTQAPAFYRFRIGAFEATVVSDGPLDLGAPQPDLFKGMGKDEFGKVLTENFLPQEKLTLEQNALVVNTGEKLVLIDTGAGFYKLMGARSGRLLENLKAAGIDPKDIDAVALTHAHPDHCWGLIGADGAPVFPNAQIHMAQEDFDFWTDLANARNDMLKEFIETTRKQLAPLRDRLVFFKDGQQFLPGIQAIAAPGHTVGHTMFMISSGDRSVCNVADIVHHHVVSLERPQIEFAYDTDGAQGARTRMRILAMLAAQRIPVIAYHFPWPGLGHVGKAGNGFRYYPSPVQTVL